MGETRSKKVCITGLYGDNLAAVDAEGALSVISTFHHVIHFGKAFMSSHVFEDVADDATCNMMIEVDSTSSDCHLDFSFTCGGDAIVEIREDTTHDVGTSVNTFNLNRGSAILPETIVKHTASGGIDGSLLSRVAIPGGTGVGSVGGVSAMREELLINPNIHKKYLFIVKNKSGGVADIGLKFTWYELEQE
jgi:hypothetical protein